MSRNFYALAATLFALALVSCGMTFIPSSHQPGLPANASLWKTTGLVLLLASLVVALLGVLTSLFEQVDRRSRERRLRERQGRQGRRPPV